MVASSSRDLLIQTGDNKTLIEENWEGMISISRQFKGRTQIIFVDRKTAWMAYHSAACFAPEA